MLQRCWRGQASSSDGTIRRCRTVHLQAEQTQARVSEALEDEAISAGARPNMLARDELEPRRLDAEACLEELLVDNV